MSGEVADANLVTGETLVQWTQDRMPPRDEPLEVVERVEPEPQAKESGSLPGREKTKPATEGGSLPAPAEPKADEHEPNKIQERFSKLAQQRRDAEERAAAAEARARELEAKLNPPKLDDIEAVIGPRPKASEFTDIDEFSTALEDWGGKRAILLDAQQRGQQAAEQSRAEQIKTFRERQAAFKEAHSDYDEVVGSAADIPVAQDLLDEMLGSDMGLAVQYYLGQNHDEIKRLNSLSPAKRMLEFGRLETRLKLEVKAAGGNQAPEMPPAATRQRQAPPEPVRPIATASASNAANGYFDANGEFTGTPEQWAALRKSGKIK
jgi:hypothetical protein